MRKRELKAAMTKTGIAGDVRGTNNDWEVELTDEETKDAFQSSIADLGGFRTGSGSWILRPNYQGSGDWNNTSSRCHY